MTSAVTRAEVEDELRRAGIRSAFALSRLMRAIDGYAIAQVRRAVPLEDIPVPPSQYGHLLPGESDMQLRITRCKGQCGMAKKWELFGKDVTSPTGHKLICKSCLRGPHHRDQLQDLRWFCPACLRKKAPEEFPQEKRDNPRIRKARCNECGGMPPEGEKALPA